MKHLDKFSFTFHCWEHSFSALSSLPKCVLLTTWRGSCLSPVCCVPLLCPCIGDLLSILHPEAFFVGTLSSGEVTLQRNWFASAVRWQDDLIRGTDLWFCKTETVNPYHRTGAQSCLNASTHAVLAVGCVLFLYDLCRSMKWRHKCSQEINKRQVHETAGIPCINHLSLE